MSEPRAESLLRSALEKIVYFEARSEQLVRDLDGARGEAERLKGELAQAGQREIALRREVAELQVQLERAHKEREEIGRLNEVLRAERTRWLDKLLESSRIQAAGQEGDLDLASFIAALRGEVIAQAQPGQGHRLGAFPVQGERRSAATESNPQSAPSASMGKVPSGDQVHADPSTPAVPAYAQGERFEAASAIQGEAERLLQQGRLKPSEAEVFSLAKPRGATESTLFGFSVRELSSPDAFARIRAAERLKALGDKAASPALASALHAERDASVQQVMLGAFAALASVEGGEVVIPLLSAASPEVRIAALKALLAIDSERALPHLAQACKDADPWVRRRASLLALNRPREEAVKLSTEAISDGNGKVRRLSTLALAAAAPEEARAALLEALNDEVPEVRSAAARSLSRLLGTDVLPVLALDPLQRRREIRRLATLPLAHRAAPALAVVAARTVQGERSRAAAESNPQNPPSALIRNSPSGHPAHPDPSTPAVPAYAQGERGSPAASASSSGLAAELLGELRASIRGRTLEDLSEGRAPAQVSSELERLSAQGQVVRRGRKYFVA